MKKKPVEVDIKELETILEKYLQSEPGINYAVKVLGHPGVGKSAIVKQVAQRIGYYFIDTRLAFKENIDLGGYPVPDHEARRMIYYRPRFIPPEQVPENYRGIVWFLDEANRAHPTVIQTLFQIITEGTCGEHLLPEKTAIVLAGNLGDLDSTTITDFDDAALDGRLAVFHLKPDASNWLAWAHAAGLHPAVTHYISLYPEQLWSEENINPNPRGWHQVSQALLRSYGITTEEALQAHLLDNPADPLQKVIVSLVGDVAGTDFVIQQTAPRAITTADILAGSPDRMNALRADAIPAEDLLWALSGAIAQLREKSIAARASFTPDELVELGNLLLFTAAARADTRVSFFYRLLRECGIFTQVPAAIRTIADRKAQEEVLKKFDAMVAMELQP